MLFFAVLSLANLDPSYQYSLSWLLNLYNESFVKADPSSKLSIRINSLNTTMLNLIYNQVCRGLFEKDKLLFSFIILLKSLEMKKLIDYSELQFVMRPLLLPTEAPENTFSSWLPQKTWLRV